MIVVQLKISKLYFMKIHKKERCFPKYPSSFLNLLFTLATFMFTLIGLLLFLEQ